MNKKIISFVICLMFGFTSYSQNYKAEYSLSHDILECVLIFNNDSWLYTEEGKIESSVKIDNEVKSTDSMEVFSFNYRSLSKNLALDTESALEEGYGIVKDTLRKPEWTIISDSIKTIADYQCVMAKGFVRGRNYTVWFTPEISVMAGPWKLWGLPGLIVSATSDDSAVSFSLASLKPSEIPPKQPRVKKTVSPEEFKLKWQQSARSIRAMFSSENIEVSDFNITVNSPDKELYE